MVLAAWLWLSHPTWGKTEVDRTALGMGDERRCEGLARLRTTTSMAILEGRMGGEQEWSSSKLHSLLKAVRT